MCSLPTDQAPFVDVQKKQLHLRNLSWLFVSTHFDAKIFTNRIKTRCYPVQPPDIFYDDRKLKNLFRIGLPSLAGDKIDTGLSQIG